MSGKRVAFDDDVGPNKKSRIDDFEGPEDAAEYDEEDGPEEDIQQGAATVYPLRTALIPRSLSQAPNEIDGFAWVGFAARSCRDAPSQAESSPWLLRGLRKRRLGRQTFEKARR